MLKKNDKRETRINYLNKRQTTNVHEIPDLGKVQTFADILTIHDIYNWIWNRDIGSVFLKELKSFEFELISSVRNHTRIERNAFICIFLNNKYGR